MTEFRGELRDFRQAAVASFNALREDVIDLRTEMNVRFIQVDERFDQVNNGFIEMRGKLDAAAAGQQQVVDLLQRLIADQG